jgi:CBS domain containing-hemolysin-like protein
MNDHNSGNPSRDSGDDGKASVQATLLGWVRGVLGARNGEDSARDKLEELIEERDDSALPIGGDERMLLANILKLRGRTIADVMVPRADIVAINRDASLGEVTDTLTREGHSRLPVFGQNLDDVTGMVHIKDVLAWRGQEKDFSLADIQRKVLFVSPSMQVLELLLEMRAARSHMAMVVDEFGGVDGLVTIEDLVEEIVGEIEDEHDRNVEPSLTRNPDGSFTADARVTIEALENVMGPVLADSEREAIDTLGGLVFALAGRVPIRGELVRHTSGYEFEILDADPRHVKRVKLLKPAWPRRRDAKA